MGQATPNFPGKIWDGLTPNPQRIDRQTDQWCNHQDWHQICSEVIAIQEYLLNQNVNIDTASLYSAECSETIQGGQLVGLRPDGSLQLADCNSSTSPSGLAITSGSNGQTVVYLRQGRIVSANWSATTGSVQLITGADYYLRCGGQMSTEAPETGYLNKVGQAQGPTIFDIDIQYSIKL